MSDYNRKQYLRRMLKKGYANKNKIPESLFDKIKLKVPKDFNLSSNANEVSNFFNKIILFMTKHINDDNYICIEYDMKDVKNVSIDALMYMLALSNYIPKKARYKFYIILPLDEKIKSFILSTGMNDYVNNGDSFKCPLNKNYYPLNLGNKVQNDIAQSICDFVNGILGTDTVYSKFIYSSLIEMMLNTENHAYLKEDWIYRPQWYTFAENTEKTINFTFLDVGMGIPETMINNLYKMKIEEIISNEESEDIVYFKSDQSKLLVQTLREGNFVSRTKQKNRGKGLPQIYGHYLDGKTSNFRVLSGKGLVLFNDEDREQPSLTELESKFHGTLFYWEINKEFAYSFEQNKNDDIIIA